MKHRVFEILKKIYRKSLRIMPIKPAVYLIYFRGYKKILNLKEPKYFGEKIQWMKLYGNMQTLSKYVDKYRVREYVEQTCGNEILIPLIGVYDSVDEINFELLPEKFVLKSTNGCGAIIICKDKSSFDRKKAKKRMEKWLKDDYSKEKKEMQYANVENRIIVEKYMEDSTGELADYKFYCFNSKVFCYAIGTNRSIQLTYDFFDRDGKRLKNVRTGDCVNGGTVELTESKRLEMIRIAEKLASKFQHVRVDLYLVNDVVKFGELTLTDGAGADPFSPLEFDIEMGKRVELKTYGK